MMKSAPTNHKPERARIFILNETIIRTSPTLAYEIGLNESMILLQLDFWISIANHYYDGRHWTYQSVRDMKQKAFPFWSIATINRAINKLLVEGYIIEGNYNVAKYDKTRWFALNFDRLSELKSIAIRKLQTQTPHDATQNDTRPNQNGTRPNQNDTTIPEITTENTTENTKDSFVNSRIDDKKPKLKFLTYRKRLNNENLEIFDMIVGNKYILTKNEQYKPDIDIKTIIGKTLIGFIEQSPEAVKLAYDETVKRGKKHFDYFAKVFFTQLEKINGNKKQSMEEENKELIDKYKPFVRKIKMGKKSDIIDDFNLELANDAKRLDISEKELRKKLDTFFNV